MNSTEARELSFSISILIFRLSPIPGGTFTMTRTFMHLQCVCLQYGHLALRFGFRLLKAGSPFLPLMGKSALFFFRLISKSPSFHSTCNTCSVDKGK
jgi:hypothetical protein